MLHRLRFAVTLAMLAVAAPAAAPALHAQAAATAASPAPGPRYDNLRAGYTAADQSTTQLQLSAAAKGPFGSKNNGKVAMIVGGAALIGGLIVGDNAGTAIAVGGLIVGLLGLWTYLA